MNSSCLYSSRTNRHLLTSGDSFGFADGISQPAVRGVDATAHKGQEFIRQGVTLLGRENDIEIDGIVPKGPIDRPDWAVDGSFLAFRYLFQLVPEFHAFLKRNPIPGLPPDQGSELLGARMVGRWMSGMQSSAPRPSLLLILIITVTHRSTHRSRTLQR